METAVLGFNSDGQGSNIREDTFWEKWWIYNGDTQIVLRLQNCNTYNIILPYAVCRIKHSTMMLIKHSASFSHLSLVTLANIFFNGHALQLLLKAARMKTKSVLYLPYNTGNAILEYCMAECENALQKHRKRW